MYLQTARSAQIEMTVHNTNLPDQDPRPPHDYSNKPHDDCKNTERTDTSQRTATHQTPRQNSQVPLNLQIQECRMHRQPRSIIDIRGSPTLQTEATEPRRPQSIIDVKGSPALQTEATKPRRPRHINSRPRLPAEIPRSAAPQQIYPPTGTTKQTPYIPPIAHQDRCKGPNKKRQSEHKTPSKGKTYSFGTNIWSLQQTTGSSAATSTPPYRAPQHRSRITKHKNGRNSGPWPLQRWTQPP